MPVTADIKKCIHTGESVDTIRKIAMNEGMTTLDENMKQIVLSGLTSIDEMLEMSSFQM
jgi:type II secretory ATPase GspE/PulE/Tfp pilus assembly ATPase PilB-like protein